MKFYMPTYFFNIYSQSIIISNLFLDFAENVGWIRVVWELILYNITQPLLVRIVYYELVILSRQEV